MSDWRDRRNARAFDKAQWLWERITPPDDEPDERLKCWGCCEYVEELVRYDLEGEDELMCPDCADENAARVKANRGK